MLEEKKACFDHKNNKLKKSKNWNFSKGLVHGFGQKLDLFPSLYLKQNRARK